MSICAFIPEPENEFEQLFNVPVATETFFKECWEPAIEALGLQWVPAFSSGIDMMNEDLPNVLDELNRAKKWAQSQLDMKLRNKLVERIELLEQELPKAFRREGVVVFIG